MNRTEIVMVVEEVHLHTTRQRMARYDQGEPILVRLLRMGRKFGISTVILDQTLSEIPSAILGNLTTRIVFRLTNAPCAYAVCASMGLDHEQKNELVEMPRRRAIIQTGSNPKPFLIHVVEIPERYRPPEDKMIERERICLSMMDYSMKFEVAVIRGEMHKMLCRICEFPFETIEERSEALGIDRAREYRVRQNLAKLGMIGLGDKVGSKWQLYVPTSKGAEWAEGLGLNVPVFKSGVGHEFMVQKVRESLGKFFADMEFFPPGKSLGICGVQPDLLAGMRANGKDGGWRMAVQISSTNKSAYEVDRAIQLSQVEQIDLVMIVAKNKTGRRALERKLKERQREGKGLFRGHAEQESEKNKGEKGRDGAVHFQECADCTKIIDFETCVSHGYDWTWVMG